ncbi:hypothetical protein ACFSM5_21195 [Lacibacterium aquatile]|uniref:Uncharacterized protein n=1 Tax=Lacibacterium aquatile TaxID=1168082 RepID=A0ABW5DWZ0_9PROT
MSYESIRLRFAVPTVKPEGVLSMEARLSKGGEAFQVKDFSFQAMPDTTEVDRLVSAVLSAGIGARAMVDQVLVDVNVVADERNDESIWTTVLPIVGSNGVAVTECRLSVAGFLKGISFSRPSGLAGEPLCRLLSAYILMLRLLVQMGYLSRQQQEHTMLELEASLLFDGIRGLAA